MTDAGPTPAASLLRPLELLERSLAWTRPALRAVPGHAPQEPTPCADWDLAQLLAHLLDGFTAFVEAAAGQVLPPGSGHHTRDPARLSRELLDLAGTVLSVWTSADVGDCRLRMLSLPAGALLEVAALEVAVHGWDVSRTCAPDRRFRPELAAALLPVAYRHVAAGDRPGRFGPVVDVAGRDPATLLLAHLGRRVG